LSADAYRLVIGVQLLGLLHLCAVVVRDIVRPSHDPLRQKGEDDPAGGVLDGAPDVVVDGRRPREPALSHH
jgi:hypothetical protein